VSPRGDDAAILAAAGFYESNEPGESPSRSPQGSPPVDPMTLLV
jgi:hypothetical protein